MAYVFLASAFSGLVAGFRLMHFGALALLGLVLLGGAGLAFFHGDLSAGSFALTVIVGLTLQQMGYLLGALAATALADRKAAPPQTAPAEDPARLLSQVAERMKLPDQREVEQTRRSA